MWSTSARSTSWIASWMTRCSSVSRSITGASAGSLRREVREDGVVLEPVVLGDDAAVARAERAERPVVLAQRHLVERRAGVAGGQRAVAHLGEHVAQLGELGAQHVVDVDQVLADEPPAARVGRRPAPDGGRCGRVASSQGAVVAEARRRRRASARRRASYRSSARGVRGCAGAGRRALRGAARAAADPASRTAGATSAANGCDRGRVVGHEDERADAVLERQSRQLARAVGARRSRARSGAAGSRPGRGPASRAASSIAAFRPRGRRPGGRAGSAASRRPCGPVEVAACAACRRRPRCRCRGAARGRARRRRAGSRSPSKRAPRRLLDVPERADHVDRLLERVDALAGRQPRAAHAPRSRPRTRRRRGRARRGRRSGCRGSRPRGPAPPAGAAAG